MTPQQTLEVRAELAAIVAANLARNKRRFVPATDERAKAELARLVATSQANKS